MDRLSRLLSEDWATKLSESFDKKVEINFAAIVGGGSINDARRIDTSQGVYFVKLNDAEKYPEMFAAEADGLEFLREKSEFLIPKPICTGNTDGTTWIIMENIASSRKNADFWQKFGSRTARMHQQTNATFGYHRDNFLGTLPQKNTQLDNWADFFVNYRLEPQIKLARDSGIASAEMLRLFDKLAHRAERYFPQEPPAALHGDLWNGNFMPDANGDAVIFDPAVYYGHREMDLGMTKLFGGYEAAFYEAYNEIYPLEQGWEDRVKVANLYYLMAHVNLFGGGYVAQVMQILRKHI